MKKMQSWLKTFVLISTLTGVSACAPTPIVEYVHVDLSKVAPQRPALPHVSGEDLACLSAATYRALVNRETTLMDYAEQCEAVINSTRPTPAPSPKGFLK